jgi:hypothetical protein
MKPKQKTKTRTKQALYVWLMFSILCFLNLYLSVLRNCFHEQYYSSFENQKFCLAFGFYYSLTFIAQSFFITKKIIILFSITLNKVTPIEQH